MKESELAQKFAQSEIFSGLDIYNEVEKPGGGVIDFIAANNLVKIAVEVKTSLSIRVIEQAYANKAFVNYSYIAVPESKNQKFAYKICSDHGIGVLIIAPYALMVQEVVKPRINRKITKIVLNDFQKANLAGCTSGERITPFKDTVYRMYRYLERQKDKQARLSDIFDNVAFHWSTLSCAKSCCREYSKHEYDYWPFSLSKGILKIKENHNYKPQNY